MTAFAVIGANYGDESKGLMTDYLCATHKADWCVRFNGSCQAGHTVVTPDGRRHVFHHFGAGSFLGVPTFLSRFFVCNPILFMQEWHHLKALGVSPQVWVDPDCPIVTVWDMILNQAMEDRRGDARHGSCGVGFGETIHRTECGYRFTMDDIGNGFFTEAERRIREDQYFPERLKELNLPLKLNTDEMAAIQLRFLEDCVLFRHLTVTGRPRLKDETVVFEGAQGLLLDQRHHSAENPYCTRSHTGLHNVALLCKDFGITEVEATYVTRPYLTRHGAGPLTNEWSAAEVQALGLKDDTNIDHPYQGRLRFAPLDDMIPYRTGFDTGNAMTLNHNLKIRTNIAVTHCDEGMIGQGAFGDYLPIRYTSHGPCRTDVREHTKVTLGESHAVV